MRHPSARPLRNVSLVSLSLLVPMLLALGSVAGQDFRPSPSTSPCPPRQRAESLRILILGDSIAAADRIAVERRWSAQLEALLSSNSPGLPATVVNRAQGGSEVGLLEKQAAELPLAQFDIVFVISGVNDISAGPIAGWRSRYAAVIGKLRQGGPTVVIGTPPPEFLDGVYTDRYLPMVQALREIADGGLILDLDRHWRDTVEPGSFHLDWIHPNANAQAVIARLAANLVLEWGCST